MGEDADDIKTWPLEDAHVAKLRELSAQLGLTDEATTTLLKMVVKIADEVFDRGASMGSYD